MMGTLPPNAPAKLRRRGPIHTVNVYNGTLVIDNGGPPDGMVASVRPLPAPPPPPPNETTTGGPCPDVREPYSGKYVPGDGLIVLGCVFLWMIEVLFRWGL